MALKNLIIIIISGLIILLGIFLFKTKKPEKSPIQTTKITIGMGYIPNIQFAPFYTALEKGYFAQENLQVDFNYGFDTDIIKLLADQKLDFAIASGDQVILAQAKDLPVINFFAWYRQFPVCVTALTDSSIKTPQDLAGKTVGIPVVYGASFIGWQTFVNHYQLTKEKINLETIGYTQVEVLTSKKADAVVTYKMNEPIQLELKGYEVNNFCVSDIANFVSNGLVTNKNFSQEKPETVKAFARAFTKGLQDTINDPSQALEISKKYIPSLEGENLELAGRVLTESIKSWQSPNLGFNNLADWQESIDLMFDFGLIEKKPDPENLFTNELL